MGVKSNRTFALTTSSGKFSEDIDETNEEAEGVIAGTVDSITHTSVEINFIRTMYRKMYIFTLMATGIIRTPPGKRGGFLDFRVCAVRRDLAQSPECRFIS